MKFEGFVESLMLWLLLDGKMLGYFWFVNDFWEEGENGYYCKLFLKVIY